MPEAGRHIDDEIEGGRPFPSRKDSVASTLWNDLNRKAPSHLRDEARVSRLEHPSRVEKVTR
jgi:hypothetical protein